MGDERRSSAQPASADHEIAEEIAAIPLMEERLSVAKRPVETGRVKVRVTVEEHEEVITQELVRDDLHIEHVPRNVRVTEVPRVRLEGNTTIVPVVEEVVVVEKALMLVEEIHICRRSVAEETQIPVTIRSERAAIERDTGARPAPDSD